MKYKYKAYWNNGQESILELDNIELSKLGDLIAEGKVITFDNKRKIVNLKNLTWVEEIFD